MIRIAAVVVRGSSPLRFAGLDLAARAERVLRRVGVTEIQVVDDDSPLADAPFADLLIVLPVRVIVEPGAVADLLRRARHQPEDAALVADAGGCETGLLLLSAEAIERVRPVRRIRSAARRLAAEAIVRVVRVSPRFIARIRDARDLAALETA